MACGREHCCGSGRIVVVITGANGFVGTALIRHLYRDVKLPAECLRAVVRSPAGAAAIRDLPAQTFCVDYDDPSGLSRACRGAAGVVHLAGVLQPRPGETLRGANVDATRRVAEAARSAAVARFVYVSAVGASTDSPNEYLRSKAMAETVVRAAGFAGAILRVPMILGRGSSSLEALRRMAATRIVPLVGAGAVRVQPIAQEDVVAAIRWSLARDSAALDTLELVGPDTVSYLELLRKVAERLGKSPRILALPRGMAEAGARVAGWVPGLGWNWSLFDTLFNEHLADVSKARAVLPFELTRLDTLLDRLLDRPPADGHQSMP